MKKENVITPAVLASYAMIKSLTDSKDYKNQYEILAEFIRFTIVDKGMKNFSIEDIQNRLLNDFCFSIPLAVIKTAMKKITECKRNGNIYILSSKLSSETDSFPTLREQANQNSNSIIRRLIKFANIEIEHNELEQAFIKYLIDDTITISSKYLDIISRFIISIENDVQIKEQIATIREGSILYCGLCYDMSEIGSIKNHLTLFLDTEILFDIAGYNGTLYHKVAIDFINQVDAANRKKKMISLKYFEDVKTEIDNFFLKAEELLDKNKAMIIDNHAMIEILNGCKSKSDIREKQHKLFDMLKRNYKIVLDEKIDYYSTKYHKYNLEDKDIPKDFVDDEDTREAMKFISHINKLRGDNYSKDYTNCKYLLVTETRRVQELSDMMRISENCSYALPMSTITNILWFKLGHGFGKTTFPLNADISYKAKRIISGNISNQINTVYNNITEEYRAGKLNSDEFMNRIIFLRDKTPSPDVIKSDNVDDLMDFSYETIRAYEQGIKNSEALLKDKERIISMQNIELAEKASEISRQNDELALYRSIKRWIKMFIIFLIVIFAVYVLYILSEYLGNYIGFISGIVTIWYPLSLVYKKRNKIKDYLHKL